MMTHAMRTHIVTPSYLELRSIGCCKILKSVFLLTKTRCLCLRVFLAFQSSKGIAISYSI